MMSDRGRWAWIAGGCVLLVACLGLVSVAGVGWYWLQAPAGTTTSSPTSVAIATIKPATAPDPTTPPRPSATTVPAAPPPATPADATAAAGNARLRAQIEENVVDIRGLEPNEPVETILLGREELRQRVTDDFFADLTEEEARDTVITLHAFDFVGLDFDYYTFTLDLYTEQVAGFYDPETDEFVVVSDDDTLDVLEQWTHAHEYVHALQDQHFDLERADDETLNAEASMARLALIEGDATLVQTLYLLQGYFTFEELGEIMDEAETMDTPVLDNAPPVLADNLAFPYVQGMEFVQALYQQGGFAAVNAAWADPPVTTEQILHPDRYLAGDTPQLVSLAPLTGTLGAGWRRVEEEPFGEFFLREYLAQQLSNSQVDTAATGWGGDRYAVYWNETEDAVVMTLRLAWDTAQDGDEFTAAYTAFATARFGTAEERQDDGGRCWQDDVTICVYALGSDTLIIRAPDLALAATVLTAQ